MEFVVELLPAARRDLANLPRRVQERLARRMQELRLNPRPPGVVKLTGADNLWRIRVGDYRILYEIHDANLRVLVVHIGHRKDVYRQK